MSGSTHEATRRYAVIIDGYHVSDGDDRGFAGAFAARGVVPVTIMSTPHPLAKYIRKSSWHPEDYAAVHFHDGDFARLLELVRGYDPVCVVPENEAGVVLAAQLNEALDPGAGNAPGSAPAHRDKGEMAAVLARAGVPGPATIAAADAGEVAEWIRAGGLRHRPLIVKPPHSGGSDRVTLVRPGGDWRRPFGAILGSRDGFELRNDTVIVQEFLDGPEYFVDLFSAGGVHGVVNVGAYRKGPGALVGMYEAADFLPPTDPAVEVLLDYARQVADALGIRNGCTHTEIILTEAGPRLVELAARYAGSCLMSAARLATGDNQVERTVRYVLDGEFVPGYRLEQPVRAVWLHSGHEGTARDVGVLAAIDRLPTVVRTALPGEGAAVAVSVDSSSRVGWAIQAGDPAAIAADYARIREIEAEWHARQQEAPAHAA